MPIPMPRGWTPPESTVEVAHRETIRSTDTRYSTREIEFTVVIEFTPRHERNQRIIGNRWVVRRLLDGESPLGWIYSHAVAKSKKEAMQYVEQYVHDVDFCAGVKRELAYSVSPFGREVA